MRKLILLLSIACCSVGVLAESAAGLRWTAPPDWKVGAAQPMRVATYAIAPGWQGVFGAESERESITTSSPASAASISRESWVFAA